MYIYNLWFSVSSGHPLRKAEKDGGKRKIKKVKSYPRKYYGESSESDEFEDAVLHLPDLGEFLE